ncbi:MAG: hypothetical protein Q4Q23_07930 [Methanobacteriaceae archaeon]|nr:hypothetical protein [Methanobacteriaceae archaeon]
MNKIAIISPYFGELPKNIFLTLESMKNNSFIDWYIYTNEDVVFAANNIIINNCTFNEFKKIVKNKIGTDIHSPYKLCDYKVTYGYVFSTILEKYDFWGYCDLDIVFGDLKNVFSEKNMNNNDKILDLGHISINRNIPDINKAFMQTHLINKDYKKILNSKYIWCFDERYPTNHTGINDIIELLGYKIMPNIPICLDTNIQYRNFYFENNIKLKYNYLEYKKNKLYLKNLSDLKESEVVYIHLQQKKDMPIVTENFNHYFITPRGFIAYNKKITKKYFFINDLKIIWYLKFRIKRKIKNTIKNINNRRGNLN